jgi:hypothetical protein
MGIDRVYTDTYVGVRSHPKRREGSPVKNNKNPANAHCRVFCCISFFGKANLISDIDLHQLKVYETPRRNNVYRHGWLQCFDATQ